ncbi:MAG: glycerol kinase, partial [Myxococcales bacterium]|nr:glycerol kinase [Myxococcales bacterium]
MGYILAIDQGTTTTTALLINKKGKIVGSGSKNYPQHYPQAGYVEHHSADIKQSVKQSVSQAIESSGINPHQIVALGITNQRETTCIFDNNSDGVYPFIVWQCKRSLPICQRLKQQKLDERIHQKTGLRVDPYF